MAAAGEAGGAAADGAAAGFKLLGDDPQALIVGAILIAVYQTAKFAELDAGDPVTSRFLARLEGARAKDFAGPKTYNAGLFFFILVSLALYYLTCQLSVDVLSGAFKLLTNLDLKDKLKGIPLPLYLAALFMGLTQPVIPGLAKAGNAQRNFFHDRIYVPRRVIDLTLQLSTALNRRTGGNKKRLAREVLHLSSDEWQEQLGAFGDLAFYKVQLNKHDLGSPSSAEETTEDASVKELRDLVETLVFYNLIAVVRRGGSTDLSRIADSMVPGLNLKNPQFGQLVSGLILSGLIFGLAILTIWHILDIAEPFVKDFLGKTPIWPKSNLEGVDYLAQELARIVPSIFICLLISVSMLPEPGIRVEAVNTDALVSFATEIAWILIVCFGVSLTIHLTAEFYQYSGATNKPGDLTFAKLAVIFVRAMPSLAVSYCALLYLSLNRRGTGPFFTTLAVMAAAVGLLAFLVALTFLRTDYLVKMPEDAPGWDYVIFYVAANVLISLAAFASILLFFHVHAVTPAAAIAGVRTALKKISLKKIKKKKPA